MKKIQALFCLGCLAICTISFAQQQDKDAMVKTIFSVLKNKDVKGFVQLFPDAADMKTMISKMTAHYTTENSPARKYMKEFLSQITDSSLQQKYMQQFNLTIKQGEMSGIDWEKAILQSYTADSSLSTEGGLQASKLKGKIYFSAGATDYFIGYDDVIWLEEKGWYGVSIKQIDKRENEEMEETRELKEVNYDIITTQQSDMAQKIIVTDSAADKVAEPGKPVKKIAPEKPVRKSVKANSQTPARKPD